MKIDRYVVKFNNGYWKVFDKELYQDVSLEYLKKDAIEKTNRLNLG